MKKLLFLLLFLLTINNSFSQILEETGPCMIQVKSMPFWTFWNYNKVINALAQKTGSDSETVRMMIENYMPFCIGHSYNEAEKFKKELAQFNCEVEIIDDETSIAATQYGMMKLASTEEGQEVLNSLNEMVAVIEGVVAENPTMDFNERRALVLQALCEAFEETED